MKNKTIAAWLAFIGGPIGLHRFYLYGWGDLLGWLLPIPTVLGLYGVYRLKAFGVDDIGSWVLLPVFGFMIAGGALTAIVYGLKSPEQWNAMFDAVQPVREKVIKKEHQNFAPEFPLQGGLWCHG